MLHRIEFEQWVEFPVERVFRFFADPRNLPRIMPAKTHTTLGNIKLVRPLDPPCDLGLGLNTENVGIENFAGVGSVIPTFVRLIPLLPLRAEWIARVTEFAWNDHFADVQDKGPFKTFHHRHELRRENRDDHAGTRVRDVIQLEVGFGLFGDLVFRAFIAGEMKRTFEHRQKVLPELLAAE